MTPRYLLNSWLAPAKPWAQVPIQILSLTLVPALVSKVSGHEHPGPNLWVSPAEKP